METNEREKVLIRALRTCNGWATRKILAAALNRNAIDPRDTIVLEMLAAQGKIEIRSVKAKQPHVNRYEYRLKA